MDRHAINFQVEIRARNKKQLKKLLKELIRLEFRFEFHTEHGIPDSPYVVTVTSCWGNNLEYIGKLLSKEDDSNRW